MRKRSQRRVALYIERSGTYGRGILEGIARYAHEHGHWEFFLTHRWGESPRPQLRRWKGDGLIAMVPEGIEGEFQQLSLPIVNVHGFISPFPNVRCHDHRIGEMGAEYLLARGLRHFGYCEPLGTPFLGSRGVTFRERVTAAGCEFSYYEPGHRVTSATLWERAQEDLARWLKKLPKPAGVFCRTDARAWEVLEACHAAGIAVPEQLAVLGVDNDELIARMTSPPLSSVDVNTPEVGYRAATLLEQLIEGRPAPRERIEIEPRGIVTRRSTEILAVADPQVAAAVRYIQEHIHRPIYLEEIARHVSLSRRSLQRRVRQTLGRSIQREIQRVRIERARTLLAETHQPLKHVSEACGFDYLEHFSRDFRRVTGLTPSAYRQHVRGD
jgi:LacI family transcriptional regulator